MIYLDVGIKDGILEMQITPTTKIRPIIAIYDIRFKRYYFFGFTKEISEPTTVELKFFRKGDYVAFAGFSDNGTFYITDLESFRIEQPYEIKPFFLIPFALAGAIYIGKSLIKS